MKRIRAAAGGLILALILGACGGPVDETHLPTLVPTYSPEQFLAETETTPSVAPETDEEEPAAEATPEPVADAPIDEEVEEAEGDEVEIEEAAEIDEADAEEPAAEDETDAPPVDDAVDDAVDDEVEAEATILPTPTPEATPGNEVEAAEDEALEEEAEIDAAAPATDEIEAAEETAVDEAEDVDTGDTEADEAEAVDEALDEDETAEEPETAIHPDWQGLPDEILAAMTTADPARGEQLSLAQGCVACHAMDPDQIMVGPTWHDMAGTARTRVEGESAGLYLYDSIIHPNDYIVEGYLPNIMLQIYEDVLNEQELADIIVYLLTLEADE